MATSDDGKIKLYNIPLESYESVITLKPIDILELGSKIQFNLVRWMPFGDFSMLAVSDFLSNIFIFKNGKLFKTILNSHSKLITDLTWIFTFNEAKIGSAL